MGSVMAELRPQPARAQHHTHKMVFDENNKKSAQFKAKAVIFAVQSLALYQYPVDLLKLFELCLKRSTCIKTGK